MVKKNKSVPVRINKGIKYDFIFLNTMICVITAQGSFINSAFVEEVNSKGVRIRN